MKIRIEQGADEKEFRERTWFPPRSRSFVETRPIVSVYIGLTEEEKAVVSEFNLGITIVEEIDEKLAYMIQRYNEDHPTKYLLSAKLDKMAREIERTKITLREYLENPYVRPLLTKGEMQAYIDTLKGGILPKIKSNIEIRTEPHPNSESFDL